MASVELIQAVAVTAELCGRTFSPEAAAVFVSDMEGFAESQVFGALQRCRREVRGLLAVADVINRIDDGRPGADEAWAMLPMDEATSAVWTDEMAESFGIARALLPGDKVGARMAFREAYTKRVVAARDARKPANWTATLGHDPRGREVVLREAVQRGRITASYARLLVSDPESIATVADAPRLTQ